MAATGTGFAAVVSFWPLLVISVAGTLNPSAGDVSVFLPTEQAYVAGEVEAPDRPRLFAMYNLAAVWLGCPARSVPGRSRCFRGIPEDPMVRASAHLAMPGA